MKITGRVGGLVLALFAPGLMAATRDVPADYSTIQAAINASSSGDVVRVAPGTYVGVYNFDGRNITLRSTGGAAVTVLDGNLAGSVFTFDSGETSAAVVQGFTIRRGRYSFGAGASLSGASPTFIDNIFEANDQTAGGFGAGIGGNGSSPLVARNLFRGNSCDSQHIAGVLAFVNGSQPRIVNNVIDNNACRGINITMPTSYAPVIVNNTITRNRVGIHVDARVDTEAQVYRNNIISGNGVGLEVVFGSAEDYPTWQYNLVYGNTTDFTGIPSQTGTNGNISADPKLGGFSAGDYHLDPGSAAIDAGSSAAVLPGEVDFYSDTRILGPAVDLGAAEYAGVPPTVTLGVDLDEIVLGDGINFTWSSTNAGSCVAEGWGGAKALNGTELFTPTEAGIIEFALRCSSSIAVRRAEVIVVVHGPPEISIQVSPVEIPSGNSATVSWSVYDGTSCEASNAWSGSRPTSGSQTVYPEAGTHVYELTCTGPGGESVASTTLTVLPGPEIVITATPQLIGIGGTTTIEWTAQNVDDGCYAYGSWGGDRATSGSAEFTLYDVGTYPFSLVCYGNGGYSYETVYVDVEPIPTIEFTVDPQPLREGDIATLTWSTTYATHCVATGEWSGERAPGGSAPVSPAPAGTHTYGLTCYGDGGESSATVTLTVTSGPTLVFSLTPIAILEGGNATLTWQASSATSCTASDAWDGARGLGGTQDVSPAAGTYVYTLTCVDANDEIATSSVTLSVLAVPKQKEDDGGIGAMPVNALLLMLWLGLLRARRTRA
jgi:hypothetical protein